MALFTAIATAALAFVGVTSTFVIGVVSAGLALATQIGVSYAMKALAGKPTPSAAQGFGVQGQLQGGGDVPRSFNVGFSVTAGSLVYANTWGGDGATPNAYLTQVIALQDLPGGRLVGIQVDGERCTIVPDGSDAGDAVVEYYLPRDPEFPDDKVQHLYVKYYDGTQTTADPFLVGTVSSIDRPYEATRVGTGVAYVIVTSLVNESIFSGFPTFKFELDDLPLYDPSRDDTVGGVGDQRYADPATWGGDGNNYPAVQAYNVMRGIYYNDVWLYGLQRMTAARLPVSNWIAQIDKCRATIEGEDGLEPAYRSGGQISVNLPISNAVETILTACQGRVSEIGGFYKLRLGAPDSPTFAFTDAEILSTEAQSFAPFFGLSELVNGIAGRCPSPEEGWVSKPLPALYNTDYEAEDGGRRLLANPSFDFVPYPAQAQRLQKSALQEARRARRHNIVWPPAFWFVEPGDVGEWTSARNGYEAKLFRADGIVDKANLDVVANLTEVDPTDYEWDHGTDFRPPTIGPTVMVRPPPQGILDWAAEPHVLLDGDGISRRPAIRMTWDGDMPGVVGVQYEVRLASDLSQVTRGRTDQLAAGAIIVSQSLIPDTEYQARGQYLPSAPRAMLWSDWIDVTTPDVRLSLADFEAALNYQVTAITDAMADKLAELEQRFATLISKLGAEGWTDIKSVRSQLYATAGTALAEIEEVRTVAVSATEAVADLEVTVSAEFDGVNATIGTHTSAISTLDGYAATQYTVTSNVNGHISGINLLNGGPGFSAFIVMFDKIQFVAPGVNGGLPIPFLTTGTVGGVPAIGSTANWYLDGVVTARMIDAGAITAVKIAAGAIDATKIAAGAVTAAKVAAGTITTNEIAVGGVDLLNIVAGAVTKIYSSAYGGSTANTLNACSVSGTIVSGTCLVILSDNGGAGAGGEFSYTLKVDGVNKSPSYPQYSGGNGSYATTMQWVVSGLSNASHTFTIGISTSAGSFLSTSGVISVIELRR